MTVKVELASDKDATTWEDITDQMYIEGARFAGTAHRGEIDTGSGFNWRDDAGTRVIPWRRRVRVTESAVAPGFVLWQGRTVGDEVARGPIRTEDAKMFDVNLVDVNADFGGIPFAGVQRPEEYDTDRIRYLLDTYLTGQARPSTIITEAYYPATNPYLLTAHLYAGVQLIDWFTHITDTTGREFFLTKDYDLFYDTIESTAYPAGISITDDGADFSTSFPPILPQGTEDATEMFTGVRLRISNGRAVTVVRAAVEAANDQWRTSIVDESIITIAAGTAKANVFLNEFDHSRTSYRVGVELPADQVDDLSWGMTVSFRSAAVGLLTPTTLRISRLSWERTGEDLWRADMELNYPTKFGRASNPGSPPVTAPPPFVPGTLSGIPVQTVTVFEQVAANITMDSGDGWATPTAGNLLVAWHSCRSGSTKTFNTPSGWTAHPSGTVDAGFDRAAMYYKLAADGDESSLTFGLSAGDRHALTVTEFPVSSASLDTSAENTGSGTSILTGSVTPTGGQPALIVGGACIRISDAIFSVTPGASWNELADSMVDGGAEGGYTPLHWMAYQQVASASGSYNPAGTASSGSSDYGGQTLVFETSAGAEETGQPVLGQEVTEPSFLSDGTTTTGSPTSYPYAPSSLRITVNGIDVSDAVTETDPTAGTYSFSTAPPVGAEIVVKYISTGEAF